MTGNAVSGMEIAARQQALQQRLQELVQQSQQLETLIFARAEQQLQQSLMLARAEVLKCSAQLDLLAELAQHASKNGAQPPQESAR